MKKSIVASTILSLIALNANAATQTEYFETQGPTLAPAAESAVSATLDVVLSKAETIRPEVYADKAASQEVSFETEGQHVAPETFAATVTQDVPFETEGRHTAPETFPTQVVQDVPFETEGQHTTPSDFGAVTEVGKLRNGQAMADAHKPETGTTQIVADVRNDTAPNEAEMHRARFGYGVGGTKGTADTLTNLISTAKIAHNPGLAGTKTGEDAQKIMTRIYDAKANQEAHAETRALGAHVRQQEAATAQQSIDFTPAKHNAAALVVVADGEPTRPETYADGVTTQTVAFETEGQHVAPETFAATVTQDVPFETEGRHTAPETFPTQVVQDVPFETEGQHTTPSDFGAVTEVGKLRNGQAMADAHKPETGTTQIVADVATNKAPNESVAHMNRYSMHGNFDEHTAEGIQNIAHNPLLAGKDVAIKAQAILEREAVKALESDTPPPAGSAQSQADSGTRTIRMAAAAVAYVPANAGDVQDDHVVPPAGHTTAGAYDAAQDTAINATSDKLDKIEKLQAAVDANINAKNGKQDADIQKALGAAAGNATAITKAQTAADKAQDTANGNTKKLNDHQTVLNQHEKQFLKLDQDVATVQGDIKTNTQGVASNKTAAATAQAAAVKAQGTADTNTKAIAKKADQTAVDTNTKAIAGNTSAIAKKADQADVDTNTKAIATNTQQIATVTAAAANIKTDEAQIKQNKTAIAANQKTEQTHFTTLQSNVAQKVSTGTFQQRAADVDARIAQHKADQEKVNKGVADHLSKHDQQIADLERSNGGAFRDLKNQIDGNRKKANAGTSTALAAAGIPQVTGDQNFALGAATGGYEGEQALAVGFSARVSSNVTVKAAVGTDSQHGVGYNAGVAIGW